MKVVAIVQARMGSSRLPGKSLLALAGRPMLAHVLERVKAVPGIHEVVLATSLSERDSALMSVAMACGVPYFRGSEWDVLGRMAEAAAEHKADAVMRVTADCPLFAPDLAALVLADYLALGDPLAFAMNDTSCDGYPDGTDVEIFSRHALAAATAVTYRRDDREHVTPFIRRASRVVLRLRAPQDWSYLKLSVDRPQDFDRVRLVTEHLASGMDWSATLAACRAAGLIREGVA